MAANGDVSSTTAPATDLDEEGHYFDFSSFYKKPEFCDRAFRLEIVKESTNGWYESTDVVPPVSKGRKRARPSASSSHTNKESEEIPVSSIVVASKSAVLRAMLSNGMKESDKTVPVTIKVTEEESVTFKEMLGFLYSAELSSRFRDPKAEVRELINLLVLGDKFQVPSFMGSVLKCITKREWTLTDSIEILDLLPDALEQRPQIRAIADEARAQILETFKDVSATWQTPMFLDFRVEVLEYLLQSEELEAESEEEIASGVLRLANEDLERQPRLTRLVPHIRFSCVKGETLADWLRLQAFGPSSATLIKNAMEFRAYSDEKKRTVNDVITCPRKGIRDVHLELVENVFLRENGDPIATAPALWFGRHWYLEIVKDRNKDPPSVGAYLCCKESGKEGDTVADTDEVDFSLYARTWPDGFWMPLSEDAENILKTFSFEEEKGVSDWGVDDALGVPWEEARRSERFTGPTGAVAFKVVVRRIGGSSQRNSDRS